MKVTSGRAAAGSCSSSSQVDMSDLRWGGVVTVTSGRSELSLRLEGSETIGSTHLAPAAAGHIHLARAAAKVPLVSLARFTASLTRATGSAGPRPASTCPAVPGRGRLSSRNPGRPRAARRRRLLCHNCDSGVFAAGPRFGAIPRDLQALFSAHRDPRALVVRPTLAARFARRLPARCTWPRTPAALCLVRQLRLLARRRRALPGGGT